MWVSDVLPGNANDLSTAREVVLAVICPFAEKMPVLADGGYEGAGHGVLTPAKKPAGMRELDINARTRNTLIRSLRCLAERGFALSAALADAAVRHHEPREDRPDRPCSACPRAIRAQNDQLKVAENTSLLPRVPAAPQDAPSVMPLVPTFPEVTASKEPWMVHDL